MDEEKRDEAKFGPDPAKLSKDYPKMLYTDKAEHGVTEAVFTHDFEDALHYVIVKNADEEAALVKKGYRTTKAKPAPKADKAPKA